MRNTAVSEVLLQDHVQHLDQFTKRLFDAAHRLPHLDPVIDALHHSFRTALSGITTNLGLLSMDLHPQVLDEGFRFVLRDRRHEIRRQHLGENGHTEPVVRLFARTISPFARLQRIWRNQFGSRRRPDVLQLASYMESVERHMAGKPMVCDEQRRIGLTIFKELIRHGYVPEEISAHHHSPDVNPDIDPPTVFQVRMSAKSSEVYFTYYPTTLLGLRNSPIINHYAEERQTAVA